MGSNQSIDDEEVIAARLDESEVRTENRYVSVADGEKVCYGDHTQASNRYDSPPSGNYGVYLTAADQLVVLDVDEYDDEGLPFDLPETLVEESPHGGQHLYYQVPVDDDGRMAAAVFKDIIGTKNPVPSWGEVQVSNKYIVAAGSELDECGKDWHDCSQPDEGDYFVAENREIATVPAERLVEVLLEDDEIEEVSDDDGARTDHAEDVDIDCHDVLLSSEYPEGKRTEHPVHGSSTGTNFKVDEGAETWRCWRDGCTGNALHLIGMQHGIIECGEWDNGGLDTETRSEIFAAAREDGYDVGERRATSDHEEPDYDDVEDGATLIDLARERVSGVFEEMHPPEDEDVEPLPKKKAIHRFAIIIDTYWHWLFPDAQSRSWVNTLYVYDVDRGIYVPSGEAKAENIVEELLGDFADNHVVAEIVNKLKRRNRLPAHQIDQQSPPPHELVVENGVLNLKTGELEEYTPEKYHTTRVDVEYDPDAECERIDEFFHEVVDADDVDTLYRLAAHMLLKEYPSRKAALLVGEGANGKGTVLDLFREFVGAENTVSRGLQSLVNYRFASQDLHGKLANLEGDLSPNELDDSRMLKKLTGNDGVTADVKMSNETVEFENHATLMFAVNSVPESPEDTHGWWSRWVYIPFPNRFDGDDAVPKHKLMAELTNDEELQGLLARCVEEIQRYYETDEFFPDVQDADEVREQMKNAANPVRDFATAAFEEVEEPDGGFGRVKKDNVVRAYEAYAEENSLPQMNSEKLKEQLQHLADIDIDSGQTRSLSEGSNREQCFVGVEWTSRGAHLAAIEQPDKDDDQVALDGEWEQDVPLADVQEYVAENPNDDVYAVMREFEPGGEAFDTVEQVIDSEAADGGDSAEAGDDGDEDADQFSTDVPEALVRETARDEPEATPADICAEYGLEDAYDEVQRLVEDERSSDGGERPSIGEELAREGGDDDE